MPFLELQTVCAGTMLLERFGEAVRIAGKDGFPVAGRICVELECSVYGDGHASEDIAGHLATLHLYRQKHLHYIHDG